MNSVRYSTKRSSPSRKNRPFPTMVCPTTQLSLSSLASSSSSMVPKDLTLPGTMLSLLARKNLN